MDLDHVRSEIELKPAGGGFGWRAPECGPIIAVAQAPDVDSPRRWLGTFGTG
jgi:hypothetical protein